VIEADKMSGRSGVLSDVKHEKKMSPAFLANVDSIYPFVIWLSHTWKYRNSACKISYKALGAKLSRFVFDEYYY